MSKISQLNDGICSVFRFADSVQTAKGGSFIVHGPFPTNAPLDFDPFILSDEPNVGSQENKTSASQQKKK